MTALSAAGRSIRDEALSHFGEVPEHLRGGLIAYLDHGQEPGGFLCALLENDAIGVLTRAGGAFTVEQLRNLATIIATYWPGDAHGCLTTRLCWQDKGGLCGRYADRVPA